ncbi:hypothetical protein HA402_002326 [Bradysia odoriphaga]|nr:hypothetical protein HA402_002326 [Bradysia odoriphaga]
MGGNCIYVCNGIWYIDGTYLKMPLCYYCKNPTKGSCKICRQFICSYECMRREPHITDCLFTQFDDGNSPKENSYQSINSPGHSYMSIPEQNRQDPLYASVVDTISQSGFTNSDIAETRGTSSSKASINSFFIEAEGPEPEKTQKQILNPNRRSRIPIFQYLPQQQGRNPGTPNVEPAGGRGGRGIGKPSIIP